MTTLTLIPLSPARSHGSVGLREYLERNERPGEFRRDRHLWEAAMRAVRKRFAERRAYRR